MSFTSVNSCGPFGVRTGGIILGYLSLVWCVMVDLIGTYVFDVFGFTCWYCLFLLGLVAAWLYGTHRNKYIYMLPYLIYSVMGSVVFAISSVVLSVAVTFELMDSIAEVILSTTSVNFKGIFNSLDAINWYFTVFMISLYKIMKAESLAQQPSSIAFNIQASQANNSDLNPQHAQTDCLEVV